MSQTKTLTDIEKGKLLRDARKRMKLTQGEMANALNRDTSYLSQLENGRRPVDDWYIARAAEIEKSNSVNARAARESGIHFDKNSVQERCHQYLTEVLEACEGDEDRLRWTFVELKRHFPLTVELSPEEERERKTTMLAKVDVASAVEQLKKEEHPGGESPTSAKAVLNDGTAAVPGGHKHPRPGHQRTPPKPVPK